MPGGGLFIEINQRSDSRRLCIVLGPTICGFSIVICGRVAGMSRMFSAFSWGFQVGCVHIPFHRMYVDPSLG